MDFRVIVPFAIISYLLQCGIVEGGHMKLSFEEELEIEKELKLLNKPAIKTIKTHIGDVYDCIDFYKQPAFDHPLLKNDSSHHQMRPTFFPSDNKARRDNQSSKIGLLSEGCPIGTVPIRRTTKEDLIRTRLLKQTSDSSSTYRAVVRTKVVPDRKYNGGRVYLSIYNPKATGTQYSCGAMIIGNGADSIEVGWMVNPSLYGDDRPRLYIYAKTNTTACFNSCMGFVIVSTYIPLGTIYEPSIPGPGVHHTMRFLIYREQVSGRWWVAVGQNDDVIGYWPQKIFNGLKDLASYVQYGGKVKTMSGSRGPEMGTGSFLSYDTKYDAFCGEMLTLNEENEFVEAQHTEAYCDNYSYASYDLGHVSPSAGHMALFGGPGPAYK